MTKITSSLLTLACLLALAFSAVPSHALNTRSFISAFGNDANPCTRPLPCRTLQKAHDSTNPSGEINMLDPAGFGTVIITKAISIVNDGVGSAGILVPAGQTGITINAGVNDKINLRGLIIEGAAGVGTNGIRFNSGKSLVVENCVVRNHDGDGFQFIANGSSSLTMSNTLVADNGGNGIYIQPLGSGNVTAVLNRVEAYNNAAHGIGISGAFATGGHLDVAVADSVAAKNGLAGIISHSTSALTFVSFFRSVTSNNGTGVATGGNAFAAGLWVSQSLIFRNNKGWDAPPGPASLYSYGDNVSENYANDDTPGIILTKK